MCISRRKLKPILQKRAARSYCSLPPRRSLCSTNHMQRRLGFFTSPVEMSLNPMAAIGIDRRRRVGPRCSGSDQAFTDRSRNDCRPSPDAGGSHHSRRNRYSGLPCRPASLLPECGNTDITSFGGAFLSADRLADMTYGLCLANDSCLERKPGGANETLCCFATKDRKRPAESRVWFRLGTAFLTL